MKVKIKESLDFLCCKNDLREFDIVPKNGIYVLTAGKFKQNLKQSEYDKIMALSCEKGKTQSENKGPTVTEIKQQLKELNVEYPSNAKKDELLEILESVKAEESKPEAPEEPGEPVDNQQQDDNFEDEEPPI